MGSVVHLTCAATGTPTPRVQLYLQGLSIISELDDPSIVQKTIVVNPETAGEYYCIASAIIVQPEGGARPVTRFRSIFIEIEIEGE